MNDSAVVYKFIYFLMQQNAVMEFEHWILTATGEVSLYDFAKNRGIIPRDYIIEAFNLGAIRDGQEHKWNELNNLWREVLSNGI